LTVRNLILNLRTSPLIQYSLTGFPAPSRSLLHAVPLQRTQM